MLPFDLSPLRKYTELTDMPSDLFQEKNPRFREKKDDESDEEGGDT